MSEDSSIDLVLAQLTDIFPNLPIDELKKYYIKNGEKGIESTIDYILNNNLEQSNKPIQSTINQFFKPNPIKPKKVRDSSKPYELPSVQSKSITLYEPDRIQSLAPCKLIFNALPKHLADQALQDCLKESEEFQKPKWYMFDRQVESNHYSALYQTSIESEFPNGIYQFNGRNCNIRKFPESVENAKQLINDLVNQYKFEFISDDDPFNYKTNWSANAAAINLYKDGSQTVGWHSDNMSHLGLKPVIASWSLGATRAFRIRKVAEHTKHPVYHIPLPHNSIIIMYPPMQEQWKHAVLAQATVTPYDDNILCRRINLTFRYYPPEFSPDRIIQCKCEIGCSLSCVFKEGPNHGRYFWQCQKGSGELNQGCGFFKWFEMIDIYEGEQLESINKALKLEE